MHWTGENSEGSCVITWDAHNANWHDRGIVFCSNNVVDRVLVWLSKDSIQVKDVISEIGNPDSVGRVVSGPDIKCAGASLLYPQTGLELYLLQIDKLLELAKLKLLMG